MFPLLSVCWFARRIAKNCGRLSRVHVTVQPCLHGDHDISTHCIVRDNDRHKCRFLGGLTVHETSQRQFTSSGTGGGCIRCQNNPKLHHQWERKFPLHCCAKLTLISWSLSLSRLWCKAVVLGIREWQSPHQVTSISSFAEQAQLNVVYFTQHSIQVGGFWTLTEALCGPVYSGNDTRTGQVLSNSCSSESIHGEKHIPWRKALPSGEGRAFVWDWTWLNIQYLP